MLNRLTSRVSPATVISTIALFVALGGGYALAFSGSGSLQKGSLLGPTSTLTSVRTLTGIGEIGAECTSGALEWKFVNTSGETLDVEEMRGTPGAPDVTRDAIELEDTEDDDTASATGHSTIRWHIVPSDGTKSPQADVSVSTDEVAGNCAASRITVLVLNTQQ